jgi:hypothetical protein
VQVLKNVFVVVAVVLPFSAKKLTNVHVNHTTIREVFPGDTFFSVGLVGSNAFGIFRGNGNGGGGPFFLIISRVLT